MTVTGFSHVNIRCADVEGTREFFERVLGLVVGRRPELASVGYWLYVRDAPIVHLVQRPPTEAREGAGSVDHIAFHAEGLEACRAELGRAGIRFRESTIPKDGVVQLFVEAPDGLRVELSFDEG